MKKVLAVLLICISMLSFAVYAKQTGNRLKIYYDSRDGGFSTYKIIDRDTGVNYVVVSDDNSNILAMCPRFLSDGSLYTEDNK